MSGMAAIAPPQEMTYRVQLQLVPPPPKPEEPPSPLEKTKFVVGKILIVVGLLLLAAAAAALAGHVLGVLAIAAETSQMLFTSSVVSIIGGYYLANPTREKDGAWLGVGPLSLYV